MKTCRFKIILLLISCFQIFSLVGLPQERAVRGCLGFGFFAEFLWAINHLDYCKATNKTPVIYWDDKSSYYLPSGYNDSTNAWEYYFEPVSDAKYHYGDTLHVAPHYNRPSLFWDYSDIINPQFWSEEETKVFKQVTHSTFPIYMDLPKTKEHVYNEKMRARIKKTIIDAFIKIKPSIQQKIDTFYTSLMKNKKTIGIHLRGRHTYGEVPFVPISTILAQANQYADGDTQFFVATDQKPLLEQAIRELRGPVIYYECERFSQTTAPIPGTKLHPKLGEDVLIEVMLLSKCSYFVHTISHIATSVLYLNPTIKHIALY